MHKILDLFVRCSNTKVVVREPGTSRRVQVNSLGKGHSVMVKVEEFQQFGKEQFDAAVASANNFSSGLQSIASAYGDYAKKSFEDTKSFVEKLSGVKSIEKAIELQTEYAKTSYETFVAESQKIGELYADLAKQAFKPFEGLVAKVSPTAH